MSEDFGVEVDEPECFTIKQMREHTGLSDSGVRKWLKKFGVEPVYVEGNINYYSEDILDRLRSRKGYIRPPSKQEVFALDNWKEYEKRIAHLEGIVKKQEAINSKLITAHNRISERQPDLIAERDD